MDQLRTVAIVAVITFVVGCSGSSPVDSQAENTSTEPQIQFHRRYDADPSGFRLIDTIVTPWKPDATLAEISDVWRGAGRRAIERIDRRLAQKSSLSLEKTFVGLFTKAEILNYEGDPVKAY